MQGVKRELEKREVVREDYPAVTQEEVKSEISRSTRIHNYSLKGSAAVIENSQPRMTEQLTKSSPIGILDRKLS